jgi:putative acetyltransferase
MTSAVTIRPAEEMDRAVVRNVLAAAFEGTDEVELVEALYDDAAYIPDLDIVAESFGDIVGHILFTRAFIEEPLPGSIKRRTPALLLAPLSVRPDFQDTGVGSRLVREGTERARMIGEKIVLVLGHPEYYPRFGFVQALPYGIKPPHDVPGEAWMVKELAASSLDGIVGTVSLAAAFDDPKYW